MANDDVLYRLKTLGAQTAQQLALLTGLTGMGVRKQLLQFQQAGLVCCDERREGVGRPAQYWQLTAAGHARFPDRHGELTAQLLQLMQTQLGSAAVETLIAAREKQAEQHYRQQLNSAGDLAERVKQLAALRAQEGYMAEARADGSGWLLQEHHCPICSAATACQGFCRSELSQFQSLFAGMATVERSEHLLSGGQRCVYRITPV
ncbi:Predicted transcriptional regulator, ArsR family [Vogesella sp. LIG4]|nr:Predicted transcriptional regulator, ArsR family [Vogesella sp. LIG4]